LKCSFSVILKVSLTFYIVSFFYDSRNHIPWLCLHALISTIIRVDWAIQSISG
jgi:hypothetical protein